MWLTPVILIPWEAEMGRDQGLGWSHQTNKQTNKLRSYLENNRAKLLEMWLKPWTTCLASTRT
jgi:hypothetical protein